MGPLKQTKHPRIGGGPRLGWAGLAGWLAGWLKFGCLEKFGCFDAGALGCLDVTFGSLIARSTSDGSADINDSNSNSSNSNSNTDNNNNNDDNDNPPTHQRSSV